MMASPPLDHLADGEATVAMRSCPKCKAPNRYDDLTKSEYRCGSCGFEMAYLDVTAGGAIRGVLGWIRREGEVIEKRYRVMQLLGRGGFGATYLVDDLQLNGKRRALKEIPKNMFDEAEAFLLARLEHPAIPDIIDRLHTEQMVYLVLKFGGARTLGSERKRMNGRIPYATLIPWMHQLCRVLAYLHAQNPPIVHRDLKPDNILLDEHDNVMLIDFGIAKLADPGEETRTLGRAVTMGFSSPEQMMGTGTDHRSDIYSLGATVYFLLAGAYPTPLNAQLAGKKIEPLSTLAPGIPAVLERAILKALELNPERRQQSVQEWLGVLEDLERTVPRPHSRRDSAAAHQRKNLIVLVSLLLGLAVLGGGGLLLWSLLSGPEVEENETPPTAQKVSPALPTVPVEPPPAAVQRPLQTQPAIVPPTPVQPALSLPERPVDEVPQERPPEPPPDSAKPIAVDPQPVLPKPVVEPAPQLQPKPEPPAKRIAEERSAKVPAKRASVPPKSAAVSEPVVKPKPKPARPKPPAADAPSARPAAPAVDWGGAMMRGETRKTTP